MKSLARKVCTSALGQAFVGMACLGMGLLGTGCGGKVVFETQGDGGSGGKTSSLTGKAQASSSGKTTGATMSSGSKTSGLSTGSGSSCVSACQVQHPEGFKNLGELILEFCGCNSTSPCELPCSTDVCENAPPWGAPMGQCASCIQAQTQAFAASPCVLTAATSSACQNNTDCVALVTCILGCG